MISSPAPAPTYDVDVRGVPRFVSANYIDLGPISQISRFRSGAGHSYTDTFESCRSMKHYFQPRFDVNWATLRIYAPVTGEVTALLQETTAGTQVRIRSSEYPAFTLILFHVTPQGLSVGGTVQAGQVIGTHIGNQTSSDVAISVDTPAGFRLVSWFDAMTDAVFDSYRARGIAQRSDAIISRAARDASPLSCSGEGFTSMPPADTWLTLR